MKKIYLILITAVFTLLLSINSMAYTVQLDPGIPLDTYTSMGEFNTDGNYDGWDFAEWGNRSVSGGSLNGTHIGGYPHMARVASFNFEVGTIVETRMKFDTGSAHGSMRFLPRINGSENIYPGLFAGSMPIQTDGNFHVYRFTLDAGDTIYFGNLTSVRFNPDDGGSAGDNFYIDYIRLADSSSTNTPPIVPPEPEPPYVDNIYNRGLLHCNTSITNLWPDGTNYWLVTPDDNSSGRQAVGPILNLSNNWDIGMDNSTIPTFMTNSPYGGDYLHFDGSSTIRATNAWPGGDNLDLDLNFRFTGLPPVSGDNYAGIFWTYPVKAYLRNSGDDTHGQLLMLVYDAAGNPKFFYSTKTINPNVWYRLSFSASNNNLIVVVGNDSEGYITDTRSETGLLAPGDFNNVIIGSDYFVPTRLFEGDLDEIKWGIIIPEPTTLFAGILLGLAFLRRQG